MGTCLQYERWELFRVLSFFSCIRIIILLFSNFDILTMATYIASQGTKTIPRPKHVLGHHWVNFESFKRCQDDRTNGAIILYVHHHCVLLNWLSNLRHQTVFWPTFNRWKLFYFAIQLFYAISESPCLDIVWAQFDCFSAVKN